MLSLGVFQLLFLLATVANVVALWRILPRAGIPGWVSLIVVVPFVLPVLLLVVAFRRWPDDDVAKNF
ncbi:MAG: hypothetical protein AAF677_17030 [Pseudomonadota bacterium]